VLVEVGPQITGVLHPPRHRPQRERLRANPSALDLFPRTRRGHRRARPRAHGVDGRKRRTRIVAADIHVDASAAVGLAELLRQVLRIARNEDLRDALRQPRDVAVPASAAHRHDDVKALRAGRFHPRLQLELREQIAQRENDGPQHVRVVA